MSNKRTIKALEELVKTEYMAIGALDAVSEETDDNKLRRQYRKFRDAHVKQADALNDRIEDLGGEALEYGVGTGKGQSTIWGKLTGMRDESSVAGMKIGAERGIKRYIDHIDDIEDPKALAIIRKNLEAKQDEMRWYDQQVNEERSKTVDSKLEVSREKIKELDLDGKNGKKRGGLPFPLLVVAGAIGAAAFFLLRRGDEDDFDDYGEDAFRYEGEDSSTGVTDPDYTSTPTYSSYSTSESAPGENTGA